MRQKSRKKRKSSKIVISLLVFISILIFFVLYKIFGSNTGAFVKDTYFYISTGSNFNQVCTALHSQAIVKDLKSFELLAKKANYPSKVKAGKYKIIKGMSNYEIIKLLGSGRQEPVKLVINKLRTKQHLLKLIGDKLEADTLVLKEILTDNTYLSQYGLDSNTVMCAILPNTYEFFWNTDAEKTFKKLVAEYIKFWTDDRKFAASQKHLTPQEVIIIASIVEEETNKNSEKKNVASVYLNRLKKGMKLQADPTARFAYGDFTIKRITATQTQLESPYNTYFVSGLPPGPICTPSEKSIEAVLYATKTDYLYFCAKEDFSGFHNFAATYSEHLENAKKYHKALNARSIR